jgi:hypothetical protein
VYKYYLKHERPQEFVYPIQHGRAIWQGAQFDKARNLSWLYFAYTRIAFKQRTIHSRSNKGKVADFQQYHRYISRCILSNSSARRRWSQMIVSLAKFLCDFEIQGVGNICIGDSLQVSSKCK